MVEPVTYPARPLLERFAERVRWTPTHWYWTGSLHHGYGRLYLGTSGTANFLAIPAHRLSYLIHKGPIRDGYEIDHLCRTPSCVNPDHLEAVTHRENSLRGLSPMALYAQRSHCINGHEFTPENTARYGSGRSCKQCNRDRVGSRYIKRDRPVPTHCRKGHAHSPENTYINKKGERRCRACWRLLNAKRTPEANDRRNAARRARYRAA